MKVTTIDLSPELKILTNIIVSDSFCKDIIPILDPSSFKSPFAKKVAEWAKEYYLEYKSAPGKNIQNIYKNKKKALNDDLADDIYDFLIKLSKDWEASKPNNVQYSISEAEKYLKNRACEILSENIQKAVDNDNPAKAEQFISNFKRVEKSFGEGVSILHDSGKVASAFIEDDELLFRFNGAIGNVVGDINRGDFISFLAPMKRGKTHLLWYTAETAAVYGYKVVFFTLEMTEKQMIRRSWQSLIGLPRKESEVTIPYFEKGDNDKYDICFKKETRKAISSESISNYQRILRQRFRRGDVRIIALPAYSADTDDIVSRLDNLEYYDNFIPDIIIIDYADIIAPTKGFKGEYRHQIDDIWKRLRRLAQERNVLVLTASQAEKSSFKTDLTELHVAEDIRKLAHVTAMIGINATKEEKEKGIIRLSQLGIREGRQEFQQAVVLQCLDIGRACLDSKLRSEVNMVAQEQEEEKEYRKRR